ncbi:MAG: single-stranded-DNA-specific exonuclease RecJ [Candidatus Dormibacteria bacterium]
MKPAPRHWELCGQPPLDGFHPVLGRVLAGRGLDLDAARGFLEEGISHDPLGLRGMTEAVITLGMSLTEGRRIAVYGDYDADGVTACALLTRGLREAGADVVPYIPNRMTEGYGLHAAALTELAEQGVGCVITVDCGTSSVEVAAGRPQGMRLIVTDHHLPLAPDGTAPALAPADALVNPKQPGCTYAFDGLAGAGVAWKLLVALEAEGLVPPGAADRQVGLAALGTVADMMPLLGENRLIVRRGLQQLADAACPGLRALIQLAGVSGELRAADLAFGIGPRINAAGRMEDARLALDLLLADDPALAQQLAGRLNTQNQTRQRAVAAALADAERQVAELPDDLPAIVLGDAAWPMGIVGLVAGRIAERYARPTFVACLDATEAKGSARSVRGVHMVRALDAAAPALLRYGGHAQAAGFSLDASRFDEFRRLVTAAVATQLGDAPRERLFRVDAAVGLRDLTPELCASLAALEPCGQGNHQPLLALLGCEVLATSTFGVARDHIRVTLGDPDGDGGIAEAIAFNKPGLSAHLPRGRRVDACFALELDSWQGVERVRLRLRDIRPARTVPAPAALPASQAQVLVPV